MRLKTVLCICILICVSLSSCVFLPFEDILQNDRSEVPETERLAELPETSENSIPEDSTEPDTEPVASPYETYVTAYEKVDFIESFEKTLETKTVVEFNGQKESFSSTMNHKATGYFSDNPLTYITFVTPDDPEGVSFRFTSGTGYFEDGKSKLKFACSFEDFEGFAYNYMYPYDPEQGEVDLYEVFKDNVTVAENENGMQVHKVTGVIKDEKIKKDLLGSTYVSADTVSDVIVDITVNINKDLYITLYKTELKFNVTDKNGEYRYEAMNSFSFSRINEDFNIAMHMLGYDDIGSFDSLFAFDAYYSLDSLPGYKATATRDIYITESDYACHDVITDVLTCIQGDKTVFASETVFEYLTDDLKYVNRFYYEDGVFYEKYGNETYETDIGEDLSPLYAWTYYILSPNCGYNYVHTDNGDGTATLEFTYTDECIKFIAANYAYINYTEEYYDMFNNLFQVSSAKCRIIYDLDTYALINHSYGIQAKFTYNNETIEFVEIFETVIETENVSVPARNIFIGTSDF